MKKLYKIKEDQFATIIKSKQIEKEGFDAGSQNKQVRECPYEKNSKEWNSWYDGWYKSHTNVNEAVGESDGSYQIKIKPEGSGLKSYKGLEFDNMDIYPISVNYNIKLIPYKYGYREMVISDIGGLDKLFVNISGYNESNEYFEEDLTVPIDWNLVEVVSTDEYGYLGLAPQMDIIFSENELSISKIILYKNITL